MKRIDIQPDWFNDEEFCDRNYRISCFFCKYLEGEDNCTNGEFICECKHEKGEYYV